MKCPRKRVLQETAAVSDLQNFKFLSKTVCIAADKSVPGLDVETHCRITGHVASKIISTFPDDVRKLLFVESTPLLAAVHDTGKINPDFQEMIYKACTEGRGDALEILSAMNANLENAKRTGRSFHAKVTQIALENIHPKLKKYISKIEGMHHGFRPPDSDPLAESCYGGGGWTRARHSLVEKLEKEFSGPECEWQDIQSWEEACALGGLIIVSDWIASGGRFAALKSDAKIDTESILKMADDAVTKAGFHKLVVRKNLSFRDIFGFEPRSVQKTFFDSVDGPGVYVLEAPMGVGKTEAALYAAYKVLSMGRATGLYFALPTQLTSNKIYERVENFLGKILQESKNGDSLKLLHGNVWMENIFGADGDIGRSWFDGKKRGILAPFAVGTIDQALMSVMNVTHSMVRSFGLAGKVLILDEIHSYDAYTGTILNILVDSVQKTGGTVILLSATLTSSQKKKILNIGDERTFNESYPLVSARPSKISPSENKYRACSVEQGEFNEFSGKGGNERCVTLNFCTERKEAVEAVLEKAFGGQQVLWIENTVREAQETFKILSARCGNEVECGLVHSRFEKIQRSENEDYWVSLYGSAGKEHRTGRGRILIGTQVLEQSLDIDADFLVSAICPTDMLLQRMGRLWRHSSNADVRPADAQCACLVVAPSFEHALSKMHPFGDSGIVYSEYVLCRSYELLKERKNVSLPSDIRILLEGTYSEREEIGLWNAYKDEMLEKRRRLEKFAGFTKLKENALSNTDSELKVQTRYSEIENVSVLILSSIEKVRNEHTNGYELQFLSGESIFVPENGKSLSSSVRLKICKSIMEHCVSVSEKYAPLYDKKLAIFKDYIYIGSDEDGHPFRCAVVGKDSVLLTFDKLPCVCGDDNHRQRLFYNKKIGYQIKREEN